MKSLLRDRPDREALTILRRCADAARSAGRVIILNGVSPDDDGAASPNLLMLVLVGGKDRRLTDFRDLAREAGLEVQAAARNRQGDFWWSAAQYPAN